MGKPGGVVEVEGPADAAAGAERWIFLMLAHGHQARVPSAKWIQTWDHWESKQGGDVAHACRLPDHYLPT